MFQKIKDIKKYIRLAKIGGVIFALIFILQLLLSGYMILRIIELQEQINQVENLEVSISNE